MNFLGQVRIAVLADGNVVDIGNLRAHGVQTGFNRQRGKSGEMFNPVEAFFGNRKNYFAVLHDSGGSVRVKHVEPENQHAGLNFRR